MVFNETLQKTKNFLLDIISFEKQKLVLPVLAVMVIFSAMLLGGHMKSQNFDEQMVQTSINLVTLSTAVEVEENYFGDQTDNTVNQRLDRMIQQADSSTSDIRESALVQAEMALLGVIYESPLFPVAPGGDVRNVKTGRNTIIVDSGSDKALFFTNEKGYYLTDEWPDGMAVAYYRFRFLSQLSSSIESGDRNPTLQEYRQYISTMRSHEADSEDVASAVSSYDTGEPDVRTRRMMRHAVNDEVKEIGVVHFLPAIMAAFIWNYLLSGIILVSYRRLKPRIQGLLNSNKAGQRKPSKARTRR